MRVLKKVGIPCKGYAHANTTEARYLNTKHELSVEQRVWYYRVTR